MHEVVGRRKQADKQIIMLFQVNTNHPSLHLPKSWNISGIVLRSIRVNQGVRIILAVIEGEDLFGHYVGHR